MIRDPCIQTSRGWNPLENSEEAFNLMLLADISLETDSSILVEFCEHTGGTYEQGCEAWHVTDNGIILTDKQKYEQSASISVKTRAARRAIVKVASMIYLNRK